MNLVGAVTFKCCYCSQWCFVLFSFAAKSGTLLYPFVNKYINKKLRCSEVGSRYRKPWPLGSLLASGVALEANLWVQSSQDQFENHYLSY